MKKEILTPAEIIDLIDILQDLFHHHEQIRLNYKLGELIQNPKIPSFLSESIAFHLLSSGELLGSKIQTYQSKKGGDLEVSVNNKKLKIEVKATGESAFQFFGHKDLDAYILIWVHFNKLFKKKSQTLNLSIYYIKNARAVFREPRKITLASFIDVGGDRITKKDLDLKQFFEKNSLI